jgi:hypothetical protein
LLQVEPIQGILATARRGVYWLRGALAPSDEAASVFQRSSDVVQKKLKRAFDYWVGGYDSKTQCHHGWDASEHGGDFVTMHVFKGNNCRLYGVKIHPSADGRYQACVVIGAYSSKQQYEAPTTTMHRFLGVSKTKEFAVAVSGYFVKG